MHYAKKKWMMKGITLALTGAMVLAGSGCSMEYQTKIVRVEKKVSADKSELEMSGICLEKMI